MIPALFGLWLVATSISEAVPSIGSYNGKRMLELYLIFVTLFVLLISSRVRQRLETFLLAIPTWVRILLLIFFGIGLSSALLTPNPAYPLLDVAMLFLLILTTLTIACTRQLVGIQFDRVIIACIALMGFGVAFQELVGVLVFISTGQQYSYKEALMHFLHPRFYNQVQTWTIPLLALLPIVFNKYRWVGLACIMLICIQWYIIFAMGARGSTISLLVAMFAIGIILPTYRKYWLKLHALGLMLGILFYLSVVAFLGAVQPDNSDFVSESLGRPMLHTTGRTNLWKYAINDAVQNPYLGAGPMRYACSANVYLPGSPHNFPLQIMSEWGIPALVILSIIVSWLIYAWLLSARSVKQYPAYKQALVTCTSISCLAAMIHVCVSGLLISPSSQVAGMLVAGWLIAILFDARPKSLITISTGRNGTPLLVFIGLAVSFSVVVFAHIEIEEMSFRTTYARDYGPITPRFWQDGRFCEYSF